MPFRTIARLNPAKPKAGEEFRLQVVAQHPNEPGTRRDAEGKLIPAKYINLVEVYAFKFKAEKAGTFTIKLKDTDGDTGEASVKLELV